VNPYRLRVSVHQLSNLLALNRPALTTVNVDHGGQGVPLDWRQIDFKPQAENANGPDGGQYQVWIRREDSGKWRPIHLQGGLEG